MNKKIYATFIMLTKRCPLRCSYCNFWEENPKNELNVNQWKKVLKILQNSLHSNFNVLMGGEPLMLGDDLIELVSWMGKQKIPYAISTNSTLSKEMRKNLVEAGLRNWSVSVDTLGNGCFDTDSMTKSRSGLRDLLYLREVGIPDLFARAIAMKENLNDLVKMAHFFTERDIWFTVTALHWKKGKYHDFFPEKSKVRKSLIGNEASEVMNELAEMVESGYKIYTSGGFLSNFTKFCDLSWHCEKLPFLAVDSDGTMRTCLYWKGERVRNFKVWELTEHWNGFKEAQEEDSKDCPGCYHDFAYYVNEEPKNLGEIIKHERKF